MPLADKGFLPPSGYVVSRSQSPFYSPGPAAPLRAHRNNAVGSRERRTILDEDHLGRMTLGDRRLEREILTIFVRQAAMMVEQINCGQLVHIAVAAHTLMGAARGIGAWRVAHAAERLQRAGRRGVTMRLDAAIGELKTATLEASAAI
ncbi:MAG: Hpt domain-containing protein, partial [Pseudolabrys sp.]|nr:Hpt domain-containing protein [Pseudolabrys sp.]